MKAKKVIKGLGITLFVGGGLLATGYYASYHLVTSYEDLALPNTTVGGVVVTGKTQEEVEAVISHKINALMNREIIVEVDDLMKKLTIKELNPTFNKNASELAEAIIKNQKELGVLEQFDLILNPVDYFNEIAYTVSHEALSQWIETLAQEVYVAPIEPTIKKKGSDFITTVGAQGLQLNKEELVNLLNAEIEKQTHEPITLKVSRTVLYPKYQVSDLETINARISTYSSHYDPSISRATNVINASKKINGKVVMPGEEFSFTELTLPVNQANGYTYGTIFVNGTTAQGLGGGMCQVSSTLYNTMLEAGILATERRAHSLPVGYVPAGQDATMTDSGIDLKFVNTLDYPIYIESVTSNGTLTVNFWSHDSALNGVDYVTKSHVYNGGYSSDSTLYGYKDGKLVYEKFLHTSNYKVPK